MSEHQVPDKVTVTVAMHYRDELSGQTVEALPVPAAAFLRAVADMLDPPRRPMRGPMDRPQGGIIVSQGGPI